MQYQVMPASKDKDGNWLFTVFTVDGQGNRKLWYGTEPGEHGMLQPKFRDFLASEGLSPAEIDKLVADALPKSAG